MQKHKSSESDTAFHKFEALAKHVFTTPKARVTAKLDQEKAERQKKRKAG